MLAALALFGRSNLLFYRFTLPTTRHHSIVPAPEARVPHEMFRTVL
jgi:hypothetical protein